MGLWDPSIVTSYHSDHPDMNNFASFHKSHIKFLAMVESGYLSPPYLLDQEVEARAKALNEKFTQYLYSMKNELIRYSMKNTSRKIGIETNHRYELYGALVAKNE
jgi:hypothetical protein